jgi:hypothetical protein
LVSRNVTQVPKQKYNGESISFLSLVTRTGMQVPHK